MLFFLINNSLKLLIFKNDQWHNNILDNNLIPFKS